MCTQEHIACVQKFKNIAVIILAAIKGAITMR